MSVVDLNHRLTQDYSEYQSFTRSSDSLIYVDKEIAVDSSSASLDLTVGDGWFSSNDNRYYAIPDDGLQLKPRESIVVECNQSIGLPLNLFGLVTGKGRFIFQGVFISSGKIDPGFCDKLRVGLYNGGHRTVTLKKNDPFCTCCFFEFDTGFSPIPSKGNLGPSTILAEVPIQIRILVFFRKNWATILTLLIALASLIISITRGP